MTCSAQQVSVFKLREKQEIRDRGNLSESSCSHPILVEVNVKKVCYSVHTVGGFTVPPCRNNNQVSSPRSTTVMTILRAAAVKPCLSHSHIYNCNETSKVKLFKLQYFIVCIYMHHVSCFSGLKESISSHGIGIIFVVQFTKNLKFYFLIFHHRTFSHNTHTHTHMDRYTNNAKVHTRTQQE